MDKEKLRNERFLVSIPHGGLGTQKVEMDVPLEPRHISIPNGGLRTFLFSSLLFAVQGSPSHTVGLEQDEYQHQQLYRENVTIPHGGLRTHRSKNR